MRMEQLETEKYKIRNVKCKTGALSLTMDFRVMMSHYR